MSSRDYIEIATQYARDVVRGKILASKWIHLACQRMLDDLDSSHDDEYTYVLNSAKATRACSFIEKLPHVKGKWAAKHELLVLQPWQVFIIVNIFGWVDRSTGLRKYRQAFLLISRKNGKSPLAAAIGLYMLTADGEHGAEVYCGATTEQQAWEVFRPARQMASKTLPLQTRLGVQINARSLIVPDTGSRFLPVIGSPGDGASPSCGICDEYHEATTSDLYDTFKTGMVGREQPLLLVITTAGYNVGSPCHLLQQEAEKVLSGTVIDDQWFVAIFTADATVDWTSDDALRMANPNYGVSVNVATLQHDQLEAKQNASKQNVFKTKHLNIWCNASVAWMNMVRWRECGDATLNIEDFKGDDCWIGLDLASKIDIAAAVRVFRRVEKNKPHYYIFPRFYLPTARTQDPTCQHYQKWVHDGHLIDTEGAEIDYQTILRDLVSDAQTYKIKCLAFDPYNATDLTQQFTAKTRVNRVEVPQNVKNLSDPMKSLEAGVIGGTVHHDANPVMTWMVSNIVAHVDANDNIFPRKQKPENKIDGVVATIIALSQAVSAPVQASYSPYYRIQYL